MNFESFQYASNAFGLIGIVLSGYFIIKINRIKSKAQNTTAASEQFQTIFTGYVTLVDSLQDELERLKLKLLLLEEEQAACERRNEELMIEVHELKSQFDKMRG